MNKIAKRMKQAVDKDNAALTKAEKDGSLKTFTVRMWSCESDVCGFGDVRKTVEIEARTERQAGFFAECQNDGFMTRYVEQKID